MLKKMGNSAARLSCVSCAQPGKGLPCFEPGEEIFRTIPVAPYEAPPPRAPRSTHATSLAPEKVEHARGSAEETEAQGEKEERRPIVVVGDHGRQEEAVADAEEAATFDTKVWSVGELPPSKLCVQAPQEVGDDELSQVSTGTGFSGRVSASSAPNTESESESESEQNQSQAARAKLIIRKFVRRMVKGQELAVLSRKGGVATVSATLDRRLTKLTLARGHSKIGKRGIALEAVAGIAVGLEALEEVEGGALPGLDELCATLVLEGGECISFRLSDVEERDTFVLCMSMFVDGRKRSLPA